MQHVCFIIVIKKVLT